MPRRHEQRERQPRDARRLENPVAARVCGVRQACSIHHRVVPAITVRISDTRLSRRNRPSSTGESRRRTVVASSTARPGSSATRWVRRAGPVSSSSRSTCLGKNAGPGSGAGPRLGRAGRAGADGAADDGGAVGSTPPGRCRPEDGASSGDGRRRPAGPRRAGPATPPPRTVVGAAVGAGAVVDGSLAGGWVVSGAVVAGAVVGASLVGGAVVAGSEVGGPVDSGGSPAPPPACWPIRRTGAPRSSPPPRARAGSGGGDQLAAPARRAQMPGLGPLGEQQRVEDGELPHPQDPEGQQRGGHDDRRGHRMRRRRPGPGRPRSAAQVERARPAKAITQNGTTSFQRWERPRRPTPSTGSGSRTARWPRRRRRRWPLGPSSAASRRRPSAPTGRPRSRPATPGCSAAPSAPAAGPGVRRAMPPSRGPAGGAAAPTAGRDEGPLISSAQRRAAGTASSGWAGTAGRASSRTAGDVVGQLRRKEQGIERPGTRCPHSHEGAPLIVLQRPNGAHGRP